MFGGDLGMERMAPFRVRYGVPNQTLTAPKTAPCNPLYRGITSRFKAPSGVAELHRRCELSQAANERYLEAIAAVGSPTSLEELSGPLCHRLVQDGRRYRALNPLGAEDARLLEYVGRGEHLITDFRNRDVRQCLIRRSVEGCGGAPTAVGSGEPFAGAVACPWIDPEDPQDASLSGEGARPGADRGDPGGAGRRGGEVGRSGVEAPTETSAGKWVGKSCAAYKILEVSRTKSRRSEPHDTGICGGRFGAMLDDSTDTRRSTPRIWQR